MIFTLGTCRLHEPTWEMINRGVPARAARHRFHSPNQIMQFFNYLINGSVFTEENLYLISDVAFRDIVLSGAPPVKTLEFIDSLRRDLKKSKRVLIEISTLRELFIDTGGANVLYLNNFTVRDIESHWPEYKKMVASERISPIDLSKVKKRDVAFDELVNIMRKIKYILSDKDILWITHVAPDLRRNDLEHLNFIRKKTVDSIENAAKKLGDFVFNPSVLLKKYGHEFVFEKPYEDFDHFSKKMKVLLSELYAINPELISDKLISFQNGDTGSDLCDRKSQT